MTTTSPIHVRDLLLRLDLGNSVAESDADLERFFVETTAFRDLLGDKCDIVAGDKGTGKTALYRILRSRYASIPELKGIEVVTAFNPVGNPVFQRLTEVQEMEDGNYIALWKTYFFSLVANWILDLYDGTLSEDMKVLEDMLNRTGLNAADDAPETVFSQLMNRLRDLTPKTATMQVVLTPQGIPVFLPRVDFERKTPDEIQRVRHDDALRLVNDILRSEGFAVWVVMDRLDEAFQGFPAVELPALRALLRTYLDMQAFTQIRLKVFIRNDLLRRVAAGGFVNLTHVNARKIEIEWESDDLLALLAQRIRENREFAQTLGVKSDSADDLFYAVFPKQVDVAERKPTTWNWMLTRIQDGNHVKPPRNLIDLIRFARELQIRREERNQREYVVGTALIESEALKGALKKLSSNRVEDTLLAESRGPAALIERFRDGKAEHTLESLGGLLGLANGDLRDAVRQLQEVGFLEASGESYKVPFLYRSGLGISQGKGFDQD